MPPDLSALPAASPIVPLQSPSNVANAALVSPAATGPFSNAGPVAATTLHASPVSLLDPGTGLVVLEFYNAQGQETESFPTKRQLESYRLHEVSRDIYQPSIHDVATPGAESPAAPRASPSVQPAADAAAAPVQINA